MIDRIGNHRPVRFAKDANGAGHMPGTGHQKPVFAGRGVYQLFGQGGILIGIPGLAFKQNTFMINTMIMIIIST